MFVSRAESGSPWSGLAVPLPTPWCCPVGLRRLSRPRLRSLGALPLLALLALRRPACSPGNPQPADALRTQILRRTAPHLLVVLQEYPLPAPCRETHADDPTGQPH